MPYDTTYMWNLKYGTNELLTEAGRDSQTHWLVVAKAAVMKEGWSLGLVDGNFYTEYINEVLLYNTNYIQQGYEEIYI